MLYKIIQSKSFLSHILIIALIIIISLIYFYPQLGGLKLSQDDTTQFKAMSKEAIDYRTKSGEDALWVGNMFSGMPAYMISVGYKGNVTRFLQSGFRALFHPASMLMLYILGFYVLLLVYGVNKWQSLIGALAFGLSSYFLIIIVAGHNSKAYALGYLPLVVAGVVAVFNGKNRLGGAILFVISLSLELLSGHLQITYYGLLLLIIYGLIEFLFAIKEKTYRQFFISLLYLLVGAIVSVGMNFSRLYTSYEYSKETIRGPSELTFEQDNKTSGLNKDYVVQWSYGIDETLTLLIPGYKGGGSQINPGFNSESYKTLKEFGANPNQNIRGISMYHGDQPGTAGPVYVGSIIVFLFFLGLFLVKGKHKWWLLISTIIAIILSWGGNVMWLTSFLLDYLPLYNKFRAPSMILVIAQITIPLLGFLALREVYLGNISKNNFMIGMVMALLMTLPLLLILILFPNVSGDFMRSDDFARYPEWLIDSIVSDRIAIFKMDTIRSLIFIVLGSVALILFYIKKLNFKIFLFVFGFIIVADLWMVDRQYLNSDNFQRQRIINNPFPKTFVDKEILKDNDISYRVLPLQNPFMDARASYYHKNVGGYHAAKLRRYDELIEYHIVPEMQNMVTNLNAGASLNDLSSDMPTINMLNTKYLIYDLNKPPLLNKNAFGNAWFVENVNIVQNANEELDALSNTNLKSIAVIDKRFESQIAKEQFQRSENDKIELTIYTPNRLSYDVKASAEQLAVFSEIYYDKGWKAYIDGKESSYFRANYVLRGMVIPEGEHVVEFRFEPSSFYIGNIVSYAFSTLLILIVLIYFIGLYMKDANRKKLEIAGSENQEL